MRRCISSAWLVSMLACSPESHRPAVLEIKVLRLRWSTVATPGWIDPKPFVTAPVNGGTTVFAVNYFPDSGLETLYSATWNPNDGLQNQTELLTTNQCCVGALVWNQAALLYDYTLRSGFRTFVAHVPDSGFAPKILSEDRIHSGAPDQIGGLTGGQVWIVRQAEVELFPRVCTFDSQFSIDLMGRDSDGGIIKRPCILDTVSADGGALRGGPFDIHPFRRLITLPTVAFASFDRTGAIENFVDAPLTENVPWTQRFWPGTDGPPWVLVDELRPGPFSGQFRYEGLFEWRWEDGGVVRRLSPLSGVIRDVNGINLTTKGTVVWGAAEGNTAPSEDGGYRDNFYQGNQRLALVTNDGEQLLGAVEIEADPDHHDIYPTYLGEADGQLYVFGERVRAAPETYFHELWYAPLDF